jgi:predicted outer membrane repeat protein
MSAVNVPDGLHCMLPVWPRLTEAVPTAQLECTDEHSSELHVRLCDVSSHTLFHGNTARSPGGALAAAVSKAGGLGLVGGGYCDRRWVLDQLDIAASLKQRVGCGFITWALAKSECMYC